MLERRPMLGLLIGLTVCVSIWRISLQETSMVATEVSYTSQFQSQIAHQPSASYIISADTLSSLTSATYSSGAQWRNNAPNGNTNYPNILNINNNNNSINNSQNNYSRSSNYNLSLVSYPSSATVNYDVLPKDDLNSLIDMHDFEFVMNQLPCRSLSVSSDGISSKSASDSRNRNSDSDYPRTPLVLILVHSAPGNHQKRLLIRETWGSLNDPMLRLIFLLGTVNSTDEQRNLELENSMFSDMVQGNFIDAYRNMTYKHVMALKWFTYYCPDVKFILKVDDDVFVNTPYLMRYLNYVADSRNLLFCQIIYWSRVKRSYRSKWRVSTKEYSGRYYPPYCPGYAIIYSPDVAFKLYAEAQKTPYFWIDDVHITGTLSKRQNITITTFIEFVLGKRDCEKILAGKTDISDYVFLFTWPDIQEKQTRSLWNLVRYLR